MKTDNAPDLSFAGVNAMCEKTPYQAPVLKVYGTVNQLTAGSATMGTADGGSGMSML